MSLSEELPTPAPVAGRLVGHFQNRPLEDHGSGWASLWDSDEADLWDRGKPSPALVDLIEQEKDNATFQPLTPNATPGRVSFVEGDFFKLDWERQVSAEGGVQFYLVYDYTFLCALHPQMRPQWVARMGQLVAPDGVLICLEFPMYKDPTHAGPAWGLNGVHWDLLARGGDGVQNIGKKAEVDQIDQLPGQFKRLLYLKPVRSYEAGRGEDMLSVYALKYPINATGVLVVMPRGLHNPLPASLRSECKKASQILESFLNAPYFGNPGKELPAKVLTNAKGLAICTVAKAGMLGSARFGSGIVIARLNDDSWSAPSAISLGGVGFGGQFGIELTDFVFFLDDAALRSFSRMGSLTLSANISIAFGPVGRSTEFSGNANLEGLATMFAYSKTKGLFGGISVEGGLLVERRFANKKLYNCKVTANQLLHGEIPPPPEAAPLLRILQTDRFQKNVTMPASEPSTRGLELPTGPENQPPVELPHEEIQRESHNFPAELHGESSVTLPVELPAEPVTHRPQEPITHTTGENEEPQNHLQTRTGIKRKPHNALSSEVIPLELQSVSRTDTLEKAKIPHIIEASVPSTATQTV
ncbi:hypothetical protein BDV28DRAFT_154911 [Aspergillus coremiiformis]|uniref:Ysc84 actin-binding domain-containing protein n=1 Tax=Aspergillus coremiiformis TaxID=138285 RepID=A0A5N6ZED8_9EURO|nr:hypothetical protein BDV28DRAFT_154911 [Aspergillus coremiiformis]